MNSLQKLGFPEKTKLLIIHADDAGLSHAENMATIQSLETGIVNSYSIMVPCPGFNEMASFARNNPQYDHGIHLTLTCEWENYKFGPVLPISEVPSLVDNNGHFYKKREQLNKYALPEHVEKELQAQIGKALKSGLIPSHLDNDEMKEITVNHPNFGSAWRQIDFDFFTNKENRLKLEENNIKLISWYDIKKKSA